MIIENVKPQSKGALVAKFDVILENMGITIRDCSLLVKGNKKWIGMPQRGYKDGEELKYFPIVEISKDKKEAFDRKCLDLLKNEHGL